MGDICKRCRRVFAVDDWDNSPDFSHVCGTQYKDPDEDATAEIECRDYAIASLTVRLREAGDRQRAWGAERVTHERTNGNLRARLESALKVIEAAGQMSEFLPCGALLTAPLAMKKRDFDSALAEFRMVHK